VVNDLDGLHAKIAAKGVIILWAPENKPWGRRESELSTL